MKSPLIVWRAVIVIVSLGCSSATENSGANDSTITKPRRLVSVWMHRLDWDKAVTSLNANRDLIREISPVWYSVAEGGTIVKEAGASVNDVRVVNLSRQEKILLRPLLYNVTSTGSRPDLIRPLLLDATLRRKHIEEIKKIVLENDYDGIDLDYEGLSILEHGDLAVLVEELGSELHASGKTLAVSLETKNSDDVAPHWTRIANVADEIRILAFGGRKAVPSPVVDLNRVQTNLERASRAMPVSKLNLGTALYGLSWNPSGGGSGTWEKFNGNAVTKGLHVHRDSVTKSPWYFDGVETVWYVDAQSLGIVLESGWQIGTRRFSFWRLGGEDPDVWKVVSRYATKL